MSRGNGADQPDDYGRFGPPVGAPREPGSDDDKGDGKQPERNPINWAALEGRLPPERAWIVNHWLTYGPTLLAGQGGIGKTHVAQTLATAIATATPYVDAIPTPHTVLFWACEDDHDELWRRQIAICNHFDLSLTELTRLIVEPRMGKENALMLTAFGNPMLTPLHGELRAQVNDYGATVLIIDNVGQCFGGNENDRHHVTAFLSSLVGLSQQPLSVIMLGHPAKSVGSEYSGSTAWEAAVRMRWYLGTQLPDQKTDPDVEQEDSNVRFLCKRKANYSSLDFRQLTYIDGCYHCAMPENLSGPSFREKYGGQARKVYAQELVLAAVQQFYRANVRVTAGYTSPDFLVTKMQEIRICQDYTQRELREALTALRVAGKIIDAPIGQYKSRASQYGLAPAGSV